MQLLKKISFLALALLFINFLNAQEKPKSPPEKATGMINGATIQINYGSPSVRGRKIWGELVPFNEIKGNKKS